MSRALLIRLVSLLVAAAAFAANGAQSHLRANPGETISISMCSQNGKRSVDLTLGGGPAEADMDSCCGDCSLPGALPVLASLFAAPPFIAVTIVNTDLPEAVSPRSPLWPGAPPQGPPLSL